MGRYVRCSICDDQESNCCAVSLQRHTGVLATRAAGELGFHVAWDLGNSTLFTCVPQLGFCFDQEMKLAKIREIRGRSSEEPLKEVSVLQHLAESGMHPNVLSCTEVRYTSFV